MHNQHYNQFYSTDQVFGFLSSKGQIFLKNLIFPIFKILVSKNSTSVSLENLREARVYISTLNHLVKRSTKWSYI